jgi:hypothetical protein
VHGPNSRLESAAFIAQCGKHLLDVITIHKPLPESPPHVTQWFKTCAYRVLMVRLESTGLFPFHSGCPIAPLIVVCLYCRTFQQTRRYSGYARTCLLSFDSKLTICHFVKERCSKYTVTLPRLFPHVAMSKHQNIPPSTLRLTAHSEGSPWTMGANSVQIVKERHSVARPMMDAFGNLQKQSAK